MTWIFFLSWLTTILIEVPLFVLFFRKSWRMAVLFALLVNTFTNPPAVYAYHILDYSKHGIELTVILVETALIYWGLRQSLGRAFVISLLTNVSSGYLYPFLWELFKEV